MQPKIDLQIISENFKKNIIENNGIIRFVDKNNYAKSFGEEWERFGRIQFDFFNENNLSYERFLRTTGLTTNGLKGLKVLDAGSGAGRHSESALKFNPAELHAVDFSIAIDQCKKNLQEAKYDLNNIYFYQCSIDNLPFKDNTFDFIFCMGVIQHTMSPSKTLKELKRVLKPKGKIIVDTYKFSFKSYTYLQWFYRLIFKNLGYKKSNNLIRKFAPTIFPIHRKFMDIPILSSLIWKLFPFDSKFPNLKLNREEELEWFKMSIEDGYLSEYIHTQTKRSFLKLANEVGLKYPEVVYQNFGDAAPLVLRAFK